MELRPQWPYETDSALVLKSESRHLERICCVNSLGELVLGLLFLDSLGLLWLLLIELHKLCEIELGLLEELDLSDEDILKGEYLRAVLHNLLAK